MKYVIKIFCFATVCATFAFPTHTHAQKKDQDLADRIYEKYKEREEQQKKERSNKSRLVIERDADKDRDDRKRNQRSSDAGKNKSSSSTTRDTRSSRTRDKARNERSSNNERQPARNSSRNSPSIYSRDEQRDRDYTTARDAEVRESVSLDQATNMVRRQTNGKVIGAKTTGSGSRRQHRIKVLINGSRVRTYVVSASTGEIY